MIKWDDNYPDGKGWTKTKLEKYNQMCWTCRGMGGQHFETEIFCRKHKADRDLYIFLRGKDIKDPDIFQLHEFSILLDAIVAIRRERRARLI